MTLQLACHNCLKKIVLPPSDDTHHKMTAFYTLHRQCLEEHIKMLEVAFCPEQDQQWTSAVRDGGYEIDRRV
jgi:hypothetical protein